MPGSGQQALGRMEQVDKLRPGLGIVRHAAVGTRLDEPAVARAGKMVADGASREAGLLDKVGDPVLAVRGEVLKNRKPGRSERPRNMATASLVTVTNGIIGIDR